MPGMYPGAAAGAPGNGGLRQAAAGAGAEARKVMGMAVFAGMLVATILGVVLVPVLYVIVERTFGGKKKEAAAPPPGASAQGGGHS